MVVFPGIRVEITPQVLEVLSGYQQQIGMHESGGILLGKYCPKEEHYIITAVTVPSNRDLSGPLWFVRSRFDAQRVICEQWRESSGTVNYFGEWHTHPWKNPVPSFVDRKLMQLLFHEGSNVWRYLFMIIVGLDGTLYLGVGDSKQSGEIVYERGISNASILYR